MESMEYIDLRKVGREGLKEIRRQVVRLKELGKTGKEIEELTGVRQNRASEIWTAYQREGTASLERKKYGRKPGSHMVLTPEEQENIREAESQYDLCHQQPGQRPVHGLSGRHEPTAADPFYGAADAHIGAESVLDLG